MKYFPSNFYEFGLIDDQDKTIERLKRRTLISNNLFSQTTEKSFIGKVNENRFKIISSDIGKGAFCSLNGKLNNKSGEVLVEINKPFRVLLSIILLFPVIALIVQIIIKPEDFNLIFLIVCLGQILMIRFLFIEFAYKFLSKQILNKLSDVLDIEWIRKKERKKENQPLITKL